MTQADIEKEWEELLKRYLVRMDGFGWLIHRAQKARFEVDVAAYEAVLKTWVTGFQKVATNDETTLVKRIVDLIKSRADRSPAKEKLKNIDIEATVRARIQKLRITEPSVKLVFRRFPGSPREMTSLQKHCAESCLPRQSRVGSKSSPRRVKEVPNIAFSAVSRRRWGTSYSSVPLTTPFIARNSVAISRRLAIASAV
jgi:hypothetical protein